METLMDCPTSKVAEQKIWKTSHIAAFLLSSTRSMWAIWGFILYVYVYAYVHVFNLEMERNLNLLPCLFQHVILPSLETGTF